MTLFVLNSLVHFLPTYALPGPRNVGKQSRHEGVVCAANQPTEPVLPPTITRRSGSYKPSVWDYELLMSLGSKSIDGNYKIKADQLKKEVRQLLTNDSVGSDAKLDLIEAVQRLGIAYHYKEEIKRSLHDAFSNRHLWLDDDLHTTSLRFRLLRQHGYHVSQDVFNRFRDENGSFKTCLVEDVKGMLSLYEASFLGLEGEHLLDEANDFTTKHLRNIKANTNPTLAKKVFHSMELPLHWRTTVLEARWYIDTYESEHNMVPSILDLAKLTFNLTQALYQNEVARLTEWWVNLSLREMGFSRDRILEHYYWALEIVPEPQFRRGRIELAKLGALITHIDDIYDVYGSFEELVLFTDAVDKWEASAMEQLPPYMKVTYMALLHTCNGISFQILKEQGYDITSNQKQAWLGLCKSYLVEAKWYYEGYTPSLEEYLENGFVSISTHLVLIYCYFLTTEKMTKEAFDYIGSLPSFVYNAGVLFRLIDDLGTSRDEIARGDVPKSIQCYMRGAGVTEKTAQEHVKQLVYKQWKKLNNSLVDSYPFSKVLINSVINLIRQAHCVYQFGDGHGKPDTETQNFVKSLLIEPIPIKAFAGRCGDDGGD